MIRISTEAPDLPIVIETFVALPLSSAHHQLTLNYLDISFRASCVRLSRIFVGSTSVNYLENFRGTGGEFSRYLFWGVLPEIISTFCPTSHSEFSRL
jgi:hypothetical protein